MGDRARVVEALIVAADERRVAVNEWAVGRRLARLADGRPRGSARLDDRKNGARPPNRSSPVARLEPYRYAALRSDAETSGKEGRCPTTGSCPGSSTGARRPAWSRSRKTSTTCGSHWVPELALSRRTASSMPR